MTFTPIETAAAACALLLLAYGLRRVSPPLDRFNVPTPVLAGLIAALAALAVKLAGLPPVKFDAALQPPLMTAFFTTLGFAASLRLLREGGPQVAFLLAAAAVLAVVQGLVGAGIAVAFGLPPLTGVLTGTVTLSGGPATGVAFAPQFEAAGVAGAATIATANAMAGIVLAGVFAAPLATLLIERHRLDPRLTPPAPADVRSQASPAGAVAAPAADQPALVFAIIKVVAAIVLCMWLGGLISAGLTRAGMTLPGYIGAMIVAAVVRNLDDLTGTLRLPLSAISTAGSTALAFALVLAMMNLDLTLLAGLAAPLMVNLLVQVAIVALAVVGPVWWLMGRDYDAAVAAGGFAGFMLGITANAVAAMNALVEKYAPAPRAFLSVPLVGGFFVDFANAMIATVFLNILT